MTRHRFAAAAIAIQLAFTSGCSSDDPGREDTAPQTGDTVATPPVDPGIAIDGSDVYFTTEKFTVDPGAERFLCYAVTTTEDLAIAGYAHEGKPVLHHVVFSEATAPEPEGLSECDTLFRLTWEPLYLAGAGDSGIDFPDGMGQRLPAGTQLVAQLHLLNASAEPVTDSVTLHLKRATTPDPRPIGTYVFGTLGLRLPALQEATVSGECTLKEDVEMIAAFPHMHLLGKSLTLEAGATADTLETVFDRDPYDFNDQRLEPFDLSLKAGDLTRITCNYDNVLDQEVTFGESTNDEMCFFIGFSPDRDGISACMFAGDGAVGDPVPNDPAAGVCGDQAPTSDGLGAPCTAGGNECSGTMSCTADYRDNQTNGVCFSLGCEASADCGGEFMTCCSPPSGGGAFNICIPESCRDPACVPR